MAKFRTELQDTLQKASHTTKKPTVLLLGGSGAGKSSLVNAVFGKPLAEIGEGKPITQNYTRFSGADSPVVIYDSRYVNLTATSIVDRDRHRCIDCWSLLN